MNDHSNIVPLRQPGAIGDPLTDVLRHGARQLPAQAVEMEARDFLAAMQEKKLADGRDRIVRHGRGLEREIHTWTGPVALRRGKIRDLGAGGDETRSASKSSIRNGRARMVAGKSATSRPATMSMSGPAASISRRGWRTMPDACRRRPGRPRRAGRSGPAFRPGSRERAELARTAARPEEAGPGDCAPGFRKAIDEFLPGTRRRRRRWHTSVNVLNKLSKSVQPAIKKELAEFRMSPGRAAAKAAIG